MFVPLAQVPDDVLLIARQFVTIKFAIRTAGAPGQLALAVEPDGGKLWVVWTQGKYLWATRLRDAAHASAPIVVRTPLPAGRTAYAMEAVGLAGRVAPVLNVSDFACFLQKYANGCP